MVLLPSLAIDGIKTIMKAELVQNSKFNITDTAFFRIKIWSVPKPVPASQHSFKYSLALVIDGVCIMRYDNEAGKGDHKHLGDVEVPYNFESIDKLISDFTADMRRYLK